MGQSRMLLFIFVHLTFYFKLDGWWIRFFSLMSQTEYWSCRTWTGWNIWQYYPFTWPKSKAIIIVNVKSKHADAQKHYFKLNYWVQKTLQGRLCTFCFLLLNFLRYIPNFFSFFLSREKKNHNALIFFMEDCIHRIRWRRKKNFVCFWLFQCLLPSAFKS